MLAYIPTCIREFLGDHIPSHKLLHARTAAKLATGVAKSLVDSRTDALLQGRSNRDIMSLLGKSACISLDVAFLISLGSQSERLGEPETSVKRGGAAGTNAVRFRDAICC
jgi:hypothetical protein